MMSPPNENTKSKYEQLFPNSKWVEGKKLKQVYLQKNIYFLPTMHTYLLLSFDYTFYLQKRYFCHLVLHFHKVEETLKRQIKLEELQ